MTTKTKIQLSTIIFLAIVVISLLLSSGASPDSSVLFAIKRIQEKVFLNLKSDPKDKLGYMRGMLDTRLEELSSQVNRKKYSHILPSAQRYYTLAGEIAQLVIENNMLTQVSSIKEQFLAHQKVLLNLYEIYPKNTDNWEWKYIQDDINYLKIYLDQLSKSES